MRSEINGIESWRGIVPRKPRRNPSAYYGRTSKATSRDVRMQVHLLDFALPVTPAWDSTRQFSSRNSALTHSCAKNYKFHQNDLSEIILCLFSFFFFLSISSHEFNGIRVYLCAA